MFRFGGNIQLHPVFRIVLVKPDSHATIEPCVAAFNHRNSAPAERWCYMLEDRFDHVRIVFDAELVWDGQQ